MLSSLNAVISTNESTRIITGHVIYNPAYTYKFQLKPTQVNVPRQRCGLLMVAMNKEQFETISDYEIKSKANGEDVRIIGERELMKLEPDLSVISESVGALYSPEEYVVDPFLLRM